MGDKMGLGRGKRWIYPDKMKQNKETGDAFSGLSPTALHYTALHYITLRYTPQRYN